MLSKAVEKHELQEAIIKRVVTFTTAQKVVVFLPLDPTQTESEQAHTFIRILEVQEDNMEKRRLESSQYFEIWSNSNSDLWISLDIRAEFFRF